MYIRDRVYGDVQISEPVLIEISESSSMQRLKGINQGGYSHPYFPSSLRSRFEHSVGVCSILKKYGASIEEQIAGLIHDISHSAFSHCIDYVLDAGSEKEHNLQDNIFTDYVKKSEIPAILNKYGYDLDYVLNDKNFPLKEKNLPDLCADRIDYFLRDSIVFGEIENANRFLNNLTVENENWIFNNFETAKEYAELFLKLNRNYYAGLSAAVMHRTVGDYLRHALSNDYISEIDLYTSDGIVLSKIETHHESDDLLKFLFDRMNNKIAFRNDPNDYDAEVFCKSRAVDPLCIENGEIKKVSEIDTSWDPIVKEELKPKQYFIKFDS